MVSADVRMKRRTGVLYCNVPRGCYNQRPLNGHTQSFYGVSWSRLSVLEHLGEAIFALQRCPSGFNLTIKVGELVNFSRWNSAVPYPGLPMKENPALQLRAMASLNSRNHCRVIRKH